MKTVKMQIPIDERTRNGLEARAKSLGFDSAQAYIRVWAKAQVDGREINFDSFTLSAKTSERYEKMIREHEDDRKQGGVKSYSSTGELMKDLLSEQKN